MAKDKKKEWELDEGYSEDRFYTRATDPKGHSAIFHVRILEDIADQVSRLVQSKTIPEYKTAQDFIRDAVFHMLVYLRNQNSIEGDEVLQRILTLEMQLREELRRIEHEKTLKDLDRVVQNHLSYGQLGLERASEILESAWDGVSQIKDPYWKKRYQDALSKHSYMIKGAREK